MFKTITLTGFETAVKFDKQYPYFWARNLGESDIYMSVKPGIIPDSDGVIFIPAGGGASTEYVGQVDTLYFLGSGKIEVSAQYNGVCPFFKSRKGGENQQQNNDRDGCVFMVDGTVPATERDSAGRLLIPVVLPVGSAAIPATASTIYDSAKKCYTNDAVLGEDHGAKQTLSSWIGFPGDFTFEIIITPYKKFSEQTFLTQDNWFFRTGNMTGQGYIQFAIVSAQNSTSANAAFVINATTVMDISGVAYDTSAHFIFTRCGGIVSGYYNGRKIRDVNNSTPITGSEKAEIFHGSGPCGCGELYLLKLYSMSFSEDEVLQEYNRQKIKFGLK